MFLDTTGLSEYWNKSGHNLLIGPWCLSYDRRDQWNEAKIEILSNPWDDRKKLIEASDYVTNVIDKMFPQLVEYLSRIHNTRYEERYWRIIVGPWLLLAVSSMYNKFVCINEAAKLNKSWHTILLDKNQYYTPVAFHDMSYSIIKDIQYNLQQFSQIIRGIGYDSQKVVTFNKQLNVTSRIQLFGKQRPWWQRFLKSCLDRAFGFYCINDIMIIDASLTTKNALAVSSKVRLMVKKETTLPLALTLPPRNHWTARQGLKDLYGDDDFTRMFISLLPINFPTMYLEGYLTTKRWIISQFSRLPQRIVTGTGLYYNEFLKFLAAEVTHQGGDLFDIQHGGGYGYRLIDPAEEHERNVSDKFCCWGWADLDGGSNLMNLPHPLTSRRFNKQRSISSSDQILLTSNSSDFHTRYFQSCPMGNQLVDYWECLLQFLKHVGPFLRSKILFRLPPLDFGWHESERMAECFPDIQLDDHNESFWLRMQNSRLVVHDNPQTTWLESLVANVPTVCFWNPDHWEIRNYAVPFFELLEQASILHTNPRSAAEHIQSIYKNIDDWWMSPDVQAARNKFCYIYAYGREDWIKKWAEMATSN